MSFRGSLIAAGAVLAISASAQAQNTREDFAAAMAAVFPDYGHVQREAIARQAWIESRYFPCVVSAHGDEGIFQHRGPRRAALHRYAGIPMGICIPTITQVRFMRHEWESMGRAHDAFMRTRDQRTANQILRTVYEHGRPLSESTSG